MKIGAARLPANAPSDQVVIPPPTKSTAASFSQAGTDIRADSTGRQNATALAKPNQCEFPFPMICAQTRRNQ